MTKESILRKNSQHLRTEFSSLLIRKTHFSKRVSSCKLFIIKNLVTKKLLTVHQKKKKITIFKFPYQFKNYQRNYSITTDINTLITYFTWNRDETHLPIFVHRHVREQKTKLSLVSMKKIKHWTIEIYLGQLYTQSLLKSE